MNKKELLEKIISKKEYSQLPERDVEIAFSKFDNGEYIDEEKVKLTRKLLREVFSSFTSEKLLSLRNKSEEWVLKKHISTRERFPYYNKIYQRIFKHIPGKVSVIDLGAGVNGFSYRFFESVDYIAIEAVGQLVDLMNEYFNRNGIDGKAFHESLFDLDKIEEIIKKSKRPRVVFMFKVLDSLEMLERNYSKKLISGLSKLVDVFVVSFATRSIGRGTKFKVSRKWAIPFSSSFSLIPPALTAKTTLTTGKSLFSKITVIPLFKTLR